MNSFMSMNVVDLAASVADFGLQWFVQSSVVLAVGLAAAWLLRQRGAAVQSAIYRTTLVAALACPAVAAGLSLAGWTFVALRLPEVRVETTELVMRASQPAPPASPSVVAEPATSRSLPSERNRQADEFPFSADSSRPESFEGDALPAPAERDSGPAIAEAGPDQADAPLSLTAHKTTTTRWGIAACVIAIAAGWLGGILFLMLRLALDYVRLARMCRSAIPADREEVRRCEELAREMRITTSVSIARTPYLSGPCLAGVFRPMILLPEESPAELSAVLVHELAHVARNDVRWNLLRHIVAALLFPQPLVWRLARRIEGVAEEVCDDYVMKYGSDRHAYAETLVNLAQRTLPRACGAAVSLVTLRSLLARRITRILDGSHRLSLSVGLVSLCLIGLLGVSAALVAGLFGPGGPAIAFALEKGGDNDSKPATPANDATPGKKITGRVLLPSGKPSEDAHVVLVARRRAGFHSGSLDQSSEVEVLGQVRCDQQGQFTLATQGISALPYQTMQLLVRAKGCGLAWRSVNVDQEQLNFEVTLAPAAEARGRLVTSEGIGAAGLHIQIDKVGKFGSGEFLGVDSMRARLPSTVWPADVVTDADGRFVVPGVAGDLDLNLWLSQEPFAPQWWIWKRADAPDHAEVLSPAQVIKGVVVAADSGKPVPFARITAFQGYDPNRGGMTGVHGRADAEGRFRVNPFSANSFDVSAFAPPGSPYLARKLQVDWPPAATEHEVRLELPRGVLLTGKIVDDADKEVIDASVRYEPASTNKSAKDEIVTGWQASATSDLFGHYDIAVPPGPGYVTVLCAGGKYVVQPTTSDFLWNGKTGGRRLYVHAYEKFDIAKEASEHHLDLRVARGVTVRADVVGPDGKVPERLLMMYRGMQSPWSEDFGNSVQVVSGGRLEIGSVPPSGELPVYLLDAEHKNGKVVNLRAQDGAGPLRIELEDCGSATMRCFDSQGKAVPGASLFLNMIFTAGANPFEMFSATPRQDATAAANFDRQNHWDLAADEGGWINFPALIPGLDYQLYADNEQGKPGVERTIRVKPGEHQTLDDFVIRNADILDEAEKHWLKLQREKAADEKATTGAEPTDRFEFAGRVVEASGQPKGGAKIYLLYYTPNSVETKPLGVTTADGSFSFVLSKSDFDKGEMNEPWLLGYVVAAAEGFGIEAGAAASFEKTGGLLAEVRARPNFREQYANLAEDRTLKLTADDVPIEGRIVNLEGQPVAGATVTVHEIMWNREHTLDAMLHAIEQEKADYYTALSNVTVGFRGRHLSGQVSQLFPKVTTGADGRFTLRGIGRERLVMMQIEGAGIETREVFARTRGGEILRLPGERRQPELERYTFYPATFDFPAATSRPIRGVVRDAESDKPLAGVAVRAEKLAGKQISGWSNAFINTKTDAEGRYALTGLPIGKNTLVAVSDGDEPYLLAAKAVETNLFSEAATLDFNLMRGVWVRGRVTDSASGKPLRGRIDYFAFLDNPNLKTVQGQMGALDPLRYCDAEGRFKVAALPGRGIIGVMADNHHDYPRGAGADKIEGRVDEERMILNTAPYYAVVSNFHALLEVNPKRGEDVECAIELVAGKRLKGTVLDPDGKPLSGAQMAGEIELMYFTELTGSKFVVNNLQPDKARRVQFVHKARKLSGNMLVTHADSGPLQVKLAPWGVVTGRVLDEAGAPLERATIRAQANSKQRKQDRVGCVPDREPIETDRDGRFRIEGLSSGLDYAFLASRDNRDLGYVGDVFQISVGEERELGDLPLRKNPPADDQDASKPPRQSAANAAAADRIQFSGKVVDAQGKPVRGAKIFVIRQSYSALEAAPLKPLARTEADGSFAFSAGRDEFDPREFPDHWRFTPLVAVADGHALAWALAASFDSSGALAGEVASNPDFAEPDRLAAGRTLHLPADDVPIEGRIVNLEGLPVDDAVVKVIEIQSFDHQSLDEWLKMAQSKIKPNSTQLWRGVKSLTLSEQVRQLFPDVKTGPNGRFRIAGIGRDRIVRLQIEGPASETRRIYVRTQRGDVVEIGQELSPSSRGRKKIFAAAFEFPIGPSRPVVGVVRDVDTREPLAGVTIQINQMAGDAWQVWPKESLRTLTDAQGRYRITGLPIGTNSLMALAPADQPYLCAVLECETGGVQESLELDFNLKRGVWVRGRVLDAVTKKGVRADVEYYAMLSNPHQQAVKSFWGAQWRALLTDAEGRFAVPAFPGQGLIAVRAHDSRAYPRGVGADKIAGGKYSEGMGAIEFRTNPTIVIVNNFNAIMPVDPAAGVDVTDFDVVLTPGSNVAGTILGPDDEPLSGASLVGGLEQVSIWEKLKSPAFDVRHLQPQTPRMLMAVHLQNRLAGKLLLEGNESGPLNLKLEPWGSIRGRALDKNGEPLRRVELVPWFKTGDRWDHLGEFPTEPLPTDDDGRFTIDGLVPGVQYLLRALGEKMYLGVVADNLSVASGESKDVGDLKLRSDE